MDQAGYVYFHGCVLPFWWCLNQVIGSNLPTPGIGEQGVLGTAPWRTEADSADLSGGPPGAERGTGSGGTATWDTDTDWCLTELSKRQQRQLALLFIPVAFDLVLCP